ncbi:MAG: outer membrane beta-barrel protein [Roseiarcus sp.]|jgi:outer membrane immunogenic protein
MLRNAVFASMLLPITAAVATATDLPPTHKSPPGPDLARPAFAWTGFYIGLNAGGAFSDNGGAKTTGAPGFLALGPTLAPGSLGDDSSGFLGGAQIGYIHQVGALVWGVEADLDYADLKKTGSFTSAATLLGSTLTTSATTRLDYLGTARARLGYTPTARWLIYATGGLAVGEARLGGAVAADAAPALAWSGAATDTRAGYAIGAGTEFALADDLSFKLEYLRYDLGRVTNAATPDAAVLATPALGGVSYSAKTEIAGSLARAGINYRF